MLASRVLCTLVSAKLKWCCVPFQLVSLGLCCACRIARGFILPKRDLSMRCHHFFSKACPHYAGFSKQVLQRCCKSFQHSPFIFFPCACTIASVLKAGLTEYPAGHVFQYELSFGCLL